MKLTKNYIPIFLFLILSLGLLRPTYSAQTIAQRLSGRILLQVQGRGEIWYVNPTDLKRYEIYNSAAIMQVFKRFGLGITNTNLNLIPTSNSSGGNNAIQKRLAGRILLQVQSRGEAWYINPTNLKRYSLGSPQNAYNVLYSLGLGITNSDLSKIPIGSGLVVNTPNQQTNQTPQQNTPRNSCIYTGCSTTADCINNICVPRPGCAYSRPACDVNETCVQNSCVKNSATAQSTPANSPPSTTLPAFSILPGQCGNNILEYGEVCDGTQYCALNCQAFVINSPIVFGNQTLCFQNGSDNGVVNLAIGQSCTAIFDNSSYLITLKELNFETSGMPIFEITNQTGQKTTTPPLIGRMEGWYTFNNIFTIHPITMKIPNMTDPANPRYTDIQVGIKKVKPTSAVQFESNCNQINNSIVAAKCNQFVTDAKNKLAPALETMSGVSLGRCYNKIVFVFGENIENVTGSAGTNLLDGYIFLGKNMLTYRLEQQVMEGHEMLHLHDYCLNQPLEEAHSMWDPRESTLYELAGDTATATNVYRYSATYNVNAITANPNLLQASLEYPGNYYEGCSGIKSFLFSKQWLQDTNIIQRYYALMRSKMNDYASDIGTFNRRSALLGYNIMVSQLLGNTPTIINQINQYCTSSPVPLN